MSTAKCLGRAKRRGGRVEGLAVRVTGHGLPYPGERLGDGGEGKDGKDTRGGYSLVQFFGEGSETGLEKRTRALDGRPCAVDKDRIST
jgi:hypothetical protein